VLCIWIFIEVLRPSNESEMNVKIKSEDPLISAYYMEFFVNVFDLGLVMIFLACG